MDQHIIDFIELLRKNDFRVGMSEGLDAFRALQLVGLEDKAMVQAALQSTLVKNPDDFASFNALFDLFFSGMSDSIRDKLGEAGGEQADTLWPDLADKLDELENEPSALAQALLQNDSGRLEQMLREAADKAGANNIGSPFQQGFYAYKIGEQLDWFQLKHEMQALVAQLRGHGYRELSNRLDETARDRMEAFQALIKDYVGRTFDKHHYDFRRQFQERSLLDKSFFTVNPEELRRMQDVVRELAEKLKSRVTMRRKRAKRKGSLNVQATIRKNIAFGGVPFHVEYRRRKKDKPELMVLCDVSDSVRQASAFMLRFVYSVQELFARVRSFVFVSDLGEATELFQESPEPGEAIERAFNGEVINVWQNSNFGHAFVQFHQQFLHAVNNRTTVIILGDGRNNYNPTEDWVLREIAQKAKKLIWLNPEGKRSWGVGDSEMPRYVRWCDVAEEVRNLNQLRKVIDGLVL